MEVGIVMDSWLGCRDTGLGLLSGIEQVIQNRKPAIPHNNRVVTDNITFRRQHSHLAEEYAIVNLKILA
jgi:hypothetical protein